MVLLDLVAGIGVGLIGGFTSGLLGVSPGGGLVVASNLLLGSEQHVAQGISLFAQIPPTGLAGIKRYWKGGSRTPTSWLVPLAGGFLGGGVAGALAAGNISGAFLRWAYVLYLVLLSGSLILRRRPVQSDASIEVFAEQPRRAALIAIGALGGFSSGFLGIGGGLAITVGLRAGLKVPQHQAQSVSLVLSALPTTVPAAWIYWQHGWAASWLVIGAVVLGLWVGTDLGARMANRTGATTLQRVLVGFVSAMALYMVYRALT